MARNKKFSREIMIDAGMEGNPGGNPGKESSKNGRLYWLTADQGPLRKAVQHPEDVEHIGGFRAEPGPGGTDSPQLLRSRSFDIQ